MNEEKERELRAFINQIGDHELGWSIKAVEAIPPNESGKTPIFIKSF
jgi:acyl-coenzyme A synthetase/AMP-(fatty) acid ligase